MNANESMNINYPGGTLIIRNLYPEDVSALYIDSLKVSHFIENIPYEITIDKQKAYVRQINDSPEHMIYGLFDDSELIGTVGVQNVNTNKDTSLGVFLFQKERRGRGLGKILVWGASSLVADEFAISHIFAGMKKSNVPSYRTFLACGFHQYREDSETFYVKVRTDELQKPDNINNFQITKGSNL